VATLGLITDAYDRLQREMFKTNIYPFLILKMKVVVCHSTHLNERLSPSFATSSRNFALTANNIFVNTSSYEIAPGLRRMFGLAKAQQQTN
jgi:hypothetical protein